MKQLSQENAVTILKQVPFTDWLSAGRMVMPSGIHRERVGSLRELYWFLAPTSKSLPSIDFSRLSKWLEETIKDGHLAAEVQKAADKDSSYMETCKEIYRLVGARIEEAEGVLKNESA